MSPGRRRRVADVVRRRRTARLDAISALALVIPLVTVGALALVRQPPVRDLHLPPALTRLTNATVVCPSAVPGSPDAFVSTAGGRSGSVTVSTGATSSHVSVQTGSVTSLGVSGAQAADGIVVNGTDALAPGLLGLRSGTAPLTAQACGVPAPEEWFTGVGAGASHDSVIELVNPDSGPADADITLFGTRAFTARKLHGITIPAHRTVSLDLGKIVPRRVLLSAQVQVTRGRLGVHVLDSRTNLATHRVRREWLPAQDRPAPDSQLIGLPAGHATRTLQVANPGTTDARAQVKIITGDTSFAPVGLNTITIPAGSTTSLSMSKILAKALADGALGVEVVADQPVTASLLTDLGTDEALTAADPVIAREAATLLPVSAVPSKGKGAKAPMTAVLYVSADSAGSADVTAYDASGSKLMRKRVAEQQGHTATVPLPKGTAFLQVVPHGTQVRAAVVLSGDGSSVLPLSELLTRGLVPQIQPAP